MDGRKRFTKAFADSFEGVWVCRKVGNCLVHKNMYDAVVLPCDFFSGFIMLRICLSPVVQINFFVSLLIPSNSPV